tara:strand:+ start:209 stop:964 length:756 start_codon:yes stop_codon:yes gene_type:complete
MLKKYQIDEYNENGFTILDYKLPEDDLEDIKSAHKSLTDKHPEYIDYCPMLLAHDLNFLKYARDKNILECVSQVIGPDIALWNQSFFAKPAIDGKATPWHQDGQYWPIRPIATTTIWLAIDETTEENGCLEFIPGSHKLKQTKAHQTNNNPNYNLNQELDEDVDPNKAYKLCLKPGQMSLHDVFLVHGSKQNTSNKPRRGMTMRFMPTTSYYDRDLAKKIGQDNRIDHSNRTLFLMSGEDRSKKNDFIQRD